MLHFLARFAGSALVPRPQHARWLGACLLCLSGLASAATPGADQIRHDLAAGKLKAAAIEARSALRSIPGDETVRALLVEALLRLGAGALAEQAILEGQAQGWAPEAWIRPLGRAYLLQGKARDLLKAMKLTGATSPGGKADALAAIGLAQLSLGDRQAARAAFDEALGLDDGNVEARLGLARMAIAAKDYAQAEQQLKAARRSAATSAEVWVIQAAVRQARGDSDGAVQALTEALARAPGDVEVLLGRASLNIARHHFEEALNNVKAVEALVPDHPTAELMLASLAYDKGDFASARDRVTRLLNRVPEYPKARLLAALAHLRLGEIEQADDLLRKVLAASPNDAAAVRVMAALRLRQRRSAEAIALLEPLAKRLPPDPAVLGELSGAYLQSGEVDKGLAYAEQAVALAPEDLQLKKGLALGQMLAGQPTAAIQALGATADLAQSDAQGGFLLLLAELQSRQFDKALGTARQLHEKLPKNPAPPYLSGVAHELLGKPEEAREDFSQALQIKPDFLPASLALAKLDARSGNAEAAMRRYEAILAKDRKNLGALLGKAQLDAAAGRLDEAVSTLEKAHSAHPEALRPSLVLAGLYLKSAQADRAEDLLKGLLAQQGTKPQLLEALVEVLEARGKPADALRYQEQRVALTPQDPEQLRRLALLQLRNGQAADAELTLAKALKLAPDNLSLLATGVKLALKGQRYDDALVYARKIQDAQPKHAAGLRLEGDVRSAQGRFEEAAGIYGRALALEPSTLLLGKEVTARQRAGQPEQARARLTQWLAAHPRDARAHVIAAQLAQRTGQDAEAIEHYEQALAVQPKAVVVLNNLAWLYNERGDPKALALAEQAHELAPNAAPLTDTLGWVLVSEGQIQRGLGLVKQASEKLPDNPTIRYHLAVAYQKSGQPDLALQYLRPLVQSGKSFPEAAQAKHLYAQLSASERKK